MKQNSNKIGYQHPEMTDVSCCKEASPLCASPSQVGDGIKDYEVEEW